MKDIQQKGILIQIFVRKSELYLVETTTGPADWDVTEPKNINDYVTLTLDLNRISKWKNGNKKKLLLD